MSPALVDSAQAKTIFFFYSWSCNLHGYMSALISHHVIFYVHTKILLRIR